MKNREIDLINKIIYNAIWQGEFHQNRDKLKESIKEFLDFKGFKNYELIGHNYIRIEEREV